MRVQSLIVELSYRILNIAYHNNGELTGKVRLATEQHARRRDLRQMSISTRSSSSSVSSAIDRSSSNRLISDRDDQPLDLRFEPFLSLSRHSALIYGSCRVVAPPPLVGDINCIDY